MGKLEHVESNVYWHAAETFAACGCKRMDALQAGSKAGRRKTVQIHLIFKILARNILAKKSRKNKSRKKILWWICTVALLPVLDQDSPAQFTVWAEACLRTARFWFFSATGLQRGGPSGNNRERVRRRASGTTAECPQVRHGPVC